MEVVSDFVENAHDVRSIDELRGVLETLVHSVGFDSFSYLALSMAHHDPSDRFVPIVVSNFPVEWVTRYRQRRYFERDPVLDVARAKRGPFAWHRDDPSLKLSPEHSIVLAEAGKFRIFSGITTPIYGPADEFAFFTVTSREDCRILTSDVGENISSFHLIGIHTHNLMLNKFLPRPCNQPGPFEFTARERECLYWTAQGKTSWEISKIIDRSQPTVNHHLNKAVAKIGAANKCHAASKATKYGLL